MFGRTHQAEADLDVVAHQLAKVSPKDYPEQFTVNANRLTDRVTGPFKSLMYPLMGAVLLLLLIACSNVANLLLARVTVREGGCTTFPEVREAKRI